MPHSFCGKFFESPEKSATVFDNKVAAESSAASFNSFGGSCKFNGLAV